MEILHCKYLVSTRMETLEFVRGARVVNIFHYRFPEKNVFCSYKIPRIKIDQVLTKKPRILQKQ